MATGTEHYHNNKEEDGAFRGSEALPETEAVVEELFIIQAYPCPVGMGNCHEYLQALLDI